MKLLNSHSSTNVYSENISVGGKNRWLVEGLQLLFNEEGSRRNRNRFIQVYQ